MSFCNKMVTNIQFYICTIHFDFAYLKSEFSATVSFTYTFTNFLQSVSICSTLISDQRVLFHSEKLLFTSDTTSHKVFSIATYICTYICTYIYVCIYGYIIYHSKQYIRNINQVVTSNTCLYLIHQQGILHVCTTAT